MARMTDEEADYWDEYYTKNPPVPGPNGTGFFTRRCKAARSITIDGISAEAALADAYVDWLLERSFLDIACERLGTTAEALKKRTPSRLRTGESKGGIVEPEYQHTDTMRQSAYDPAELLQSPEAAAAA